MAESRQGAGCARPVGSVARSAPQDSRQDPGAGEERSRPLVSVMVGRKAPNFEAPVYHAGSFGTIRLSDYLGRWVVLCFYPGDYTFV